MAVRISKDHDERRTEILTTAHQLFYSQGYEQTSIKNVIDAVGIAKGTFYHYFPSKQALLEELVQQLSNQAVALATPIVQDPTLTAIEKFTSMFHDIGGWKAEQKDFFLDLMETVYNDNNVVLQRKLVLRSIDKMQPLLAKIIEQGIEEGVFSTAYPDAASEMVFTLAITIGENISRMFLTMPATQETMSRMDIKIQLGQETIEKVLNAPPGSLVIYDMAIMRQFQEAWVAQRQQKNA